MLFRSIERPRASRPRRPARRSSVSAPQWKVRPWASSESRPGATRIPLEQCGSPRRRRSRTASFRRRLQRSLYASRRYLAKRGAPKRGAGLAGYDLITFSGAPAAISPFFMGEALDGVRIAMRCDNALIQVQAAAQTESSPSRRSHSAKNQVKIYCQQPIWEIFKVADITRCWVACRRERSRNLGRPIATLQCRILSTRV